VTELESEGSNETEEDEVAVAWSGTDKDTD
jgi:hypothetical protein